MSFARGIDAFAAGLRLARTPGLRRYAVLPALSSLVIIAAGSYFAAGYLRELTVAIVAWLPEWLAFLDWVLTPLVYLVGILGATWAFSLLAVLIGSPFMGVLSGAVERLVSGQAPESGRSLWAEVPASLGRELRKAAYHLPRLAAVFLVTLMPVLNVVSPAIWLACGAWTMAVQFADYPYENRGRPFRDTLALLARDRGAALGFGLCATAALAIPLLSFLLIPVAVAGGTVLAHELESASEA